tara:strand:- start:3332 stop:3796 length:465 start_codon:yes stop_codon:yes gene_type:complete
MSSINIRNYAVIAVLGFLLSACATGGKRSTNDWYEGTDTVKFLASGVPDRIFFATNKSSLHTAAKGTLNKQAAYIKSSGLNVVVEGHADERGTREYNLALGERRANAVRDYLMSQGVNGGKVTVISYGKERPVNPESSRLAWSQNRRSVTIKAK